jgi:hypothetical protein
VPYATANSRQFFQADEFVTISQIWIGVVLALDRCRNMPENSILKKRDVDTPAPATIWKRSYFDLRTDVSDGFQPALRGNKILLLVVRIELPGRKTFRKQPARSEMKRYLMVG